MDALRRLAKKVETKVRMEFDPASREMAKVANWNPDVDGIRGSARSLNAVNSTSGGDSFLASRDARVPTPFLDFSPQIAS